MVNDSLDNNRWPCWLEGFAFAVIGAILGAILLPFTFLLLCFIEGDAGGPMVLPLLVAAAVVCGAATGSFAGFLAWIVWIVFKNSRLSNGRDLP